MLTRNEYQQEQEEVQIWIENILAEMFENSNRSISVVSDEYHYNVVNKKYQICKIAEELGLLEESCQKYGVGYEHKDYPYDQENQRLKRSMYVFTRLEKEKELVKTHSLYLKYQHK